jgi:hypothetical protein
MLEDCFELGFQIDSSVMRFFVPLSDWSKGTFNRCTDTATDAFFKVVT